MLTLLEKGKGVVSQFLTIAYKGGRGVKTPPNMADIICEKSLINKVKGFTQKYETWVVRIFDPT